jgi:hypothetical protein
MILLEKNAGTFDVKNAWGADSNYAALSGYGNI